MTGDNRNVSRYTKDEEKRVKALYEQDAVEYYKMCHECGISEDRIEDPGLYNTGKLETERKTKISALEEKAAIPAKSLAPRIIDGERAIKFNYKRFEYLIDKLSHSYGHISLSQDKDIGIKTEILKSCGYNYLTIGPNLVVKIEDAKSDRIGAVYLNQFNQLRKRKSQGDD